MHVICVYVYICSCTHFLVMCFRSIPANVCVLSMHVYVHVFACGSNYTQVQQHKHAAEGIY